MKVWRCGLRGSPSAISMAVIPKDHWSLCRERNNDKHPIKHVYTLLDMQANILTLFFQPLEAVHCSVFCASLVQEHPYYTYKGGHRSSSMKLAYSVVISSRGVLITSNDFRCHPVWCANERVALANGPVKLRRHTKIHCEGKRQIMTGVQQVNYKQLLTQSKQTSNVIPSLISALSVSSTF